MAQTVSNDALWEKMSDIEKKIDEALAMQKSLPTVSEQSGNTPDLTAVKDEIIADIRTRASILSKHSDVNFEANRNNLMLVNKNVSAVLNVVNHIREQQRKSAETQQSLIESQRETTIKLQEVATGLQRNEPVEPQTETETAAPQQPDRVAYLDLIIFKIKKTTLVITLLTLLVYIMTLFCMKQQNDYTLLMEEDYRQRIVIREMKNHIA